MPEVAKVEPPHPPLPPHALGFVNGGRKRRLGGAQRARAHGGAEDRDDVPVPFHEAVTPPSMYIPSRELIKAYGPCCPVAHPAQEKQRGKKKTTTSLSHVLPWCIKPRSTPPLC